MNTKEIHLSKKYSRDFVSELSVWKLNLYKDLMQHAWMQSMKIPDDKQFIKLEIVVKYHKDEWTDS